MNLLIIGGGGREHALAWKLRQSPRAGRIAVAPGNGGTGDNVALDPRDHGGVVSWCRAQGIDLVVIGPEGPLADGLGDSLREAGIRVFGPGRDGARLEGSKVFAKEFMQRHGVATAAFRAARSPAQARTFVEEFSAGMVLKFDGLASGKGVFVCGSVPEALEALDVLERRHGPDAALILEERLAGRELSILGVTDGRTMRLLPPSQDHKQLLDGDRGPNTGGMGAFCPVPFYDADLAARVDQEIVAPTLRGLRAEGIEFQGVLYFGIMVTAQGPRLLEYNVRLGDPEAEVVLPALRSDLLDLMVACTDGGLEDCATEFDDGAWVDVVLASRGYPGTPVTGFEIQGLGELSPETLVFHGGTRREGDRLVTAGGRVLNVVVRGHDLDDALGRVYDEVAKIRFDGCLFRTDIGRRGDGRRMP
ncbi:MAG: phosphoribosylamine--glycine ligase [Deltaproteobacteria bacterium]|nr:phosphoribosylamine--glycine ligase [Deltaproteobacteria bacterium]